MKIWIQPPAPTIDKATAFLLIDGTGIKRFYELETFLNPAVAPSPLAMAA